jgi:hypothetical protein
MLRGRRSKRLCRKNLPLADITVKTRELSKNVEVETHCSIPKVEITSSYKGLDQEAVNDQIAMEQKFCATKARIKTTILPEASDEGVATTDLAANATHCTESSNGSRSPIVTPKFVSASTQLIDQTKRGSSSCNPILSEGSKVMSTKQTKNPSRRSKQTAKRSLGARHGYIYPGQKPAR